MRFFLETANVDEIKKAQEIGMCDGVTTDPSLLAREGKDYRYAIREISRTCSGPVSVSVLSEDLAGMTREGRELSRIAENVVVRIPMTRDGLLACAKLVGENLRVDVTLVMSASQALLAARAGATWVSTFVGRLDDVGNVGMDAVRDIVTIYDNYELPTQILVAAVRGPNHVIEAAMTGADAVTLPWSVLDTLHRHPLTDAGIAKYRADWEAAAEKLPIKKVIRGDKEN